jgi:hypothetical protein
VAVRERYHVGTSVKFEATVRNDARDLVAPTALRLRIMREGQAEVVYNIGDLTNVSLGLYTRSHVVGAPGTWYWRWESTNPTDADEGVFTVIPSEFA